MAKLPKPFMTVAQLQEAAVAVEALQVVQDRIARLRAYVGPASTVQVILQAPSRDQPLHFVVSPDSLLDELEEEAGIHANILRRLGVEVPDPPAPAQAALPLPGSEAAPC
jgi:hypothetical protein